MQHIRYSFDSWPMSITSDTCLMTTDFASFSTDAMPAAPVWTQPEDKTEFMYVCKACGSEWNETKLHKGTCGNCGAGAYRNKTKVEIPVEFHERDDAPMETIFHEEDERSPPSRLSFWDRLFR
mgnify:CR=1 FL=1